MNWRGGARFSRAHAWVFLGLFGLSTLLTFGAVFSCLTAGAGGTTWKGAGRIALCAAAASSGPFIGAIARDWQSCCARNSWGLFHSAALVLLWGCAVQFMPLPEGRGWSRLRLLCWTAGWLFWFGSGIFSLGHALE